jgi:hypothetical protein
MKKINYPFAGLATDWPVTGTDSTFAGDDVEKTLHIQKYPISNLRAILTELLEVICIDGTGPDF